MNYGRGLDPLQCGGKTDYDNGNGSLMRILPVALWNSSKLAGEDVEAAVWCFLNTDNYKDCVLKAVNLGEDTDTVGAVAGGLAGLYYGLDEIPEEWINLLPKKEWIIELAGKMRRN